MSAPPAAFDESDSLKSAKGVETAEPVVVVEPNAKVGSNKSANLEQALTPELIISPIEDTDSDSEYTYEPGIINRKCCSWCCIILALIAALICALYFTVGPDKNQEVAQGVVVTEAPTAVPTAAPTMAPTAAPTTQLFADTMELLLPYTAVQTLVDTETPQGQALRQLVSELEASGGDPNPHRITQRYALMTLYLSTSQDGWDTNIGWDEFREDECDWYGIKTCRFLDDGTFGVSNIELDNNGLAGSLPSEICALAPNLESLDMRGNALVGDIPACLKDFDKLAQVFLNNNQFSGEIPTGVLGIASMTVIDLSQNDLEGPVSYLFGDDTAATGLRTVSLNDNRLTGDFPTEALLFPNLSTLRLHGLNMKGEVPESVCDAQQQSSTFLTTLTADCVELFCTCCTACF
mmetsp:Transcript_53/g.102  ORF Transcript_53/g.102 Transcript_53/m.102 type:complete len:406 (-) Transcript_53:1487-2704(-)